MKRREIICLLAGCMLFLAPMRVQATALPDLLTVGTINVTDMERDNLQADVGSVEAGRIEGVTVQGSDGEDSDQDDSDINDRSISGNGVEDSGFENRVEDTQETEEEEDASQNGSRREDEDTAVKEDTADTQTGGEEHSIQNILGSSIGSATILECTKTEQEYAQAYEKAKNANWGYTNLGIANVDNNLNIRAVAADDGKLVGKLPKDAACEVLDEDGTWAHIRSGKVDGYVSLEYLLTGIPAKRRAEELAVTMARVTTDSLKVRAEANTDSEVVTLVPNGEELEVASVDGDWVKVFLDDEEVFVSAEYVKVSSEL